jgi:hypothetical protein
MDLTVGELKRILDAYPEDCPVEFQYVMTPEGKSYKLTLYRVHDRGPCHFEWNPLTEEDAL